MNSHCNAGSLKDTSENVCRIVCEDSDCNELNVLWAKSDCCVKI